MLVDKRCRDRTIVGVCLTGSYTWSTSSKSSTCQHLCPTVKGGSYEVQQTKCLCLTQADMMEADYAAISAEDISELAKTYLRNEQALQVIAVCEGKQ